MPDPREEAVAPKLQALIGSYRWTDVGLKRAAAQLLAAADAVDPMRQDEAPLGDVIDNDVLRVRLAEAEADRATLTEALEKIRDAPQPESGWRIARAALAAVKGREDA